VNVEDDTREIPDRAQRKENNRTNRDTDLGLWGAEAVPLAEPEPRRDRTAAITQRPRGNAHPWIVLVVITCAIIPIAVLSASLPSVESTTTPTPHETAQATKPLSLVRPTGDRTSTECQTEREQRQIPRRTSRHSTPHSRPSLHPADQVTNAHNMLAPESTSTREPGAPSPQPAQTPTVPKVAKSQRASGRTVSREFGFEH
jgi:hypothetical protein